MQDLLNEEDFITKPYNPWKYFKWFFVISAIERVLIYFVLMFFPFTHFNLVSYFIVLATVFVMFYINKENFYIKSWLIFFSVFTFFMVQLVTTLVMNILNIAGRDISMEQYIESFIANLAFWCGHFVVIGVVLWYISQLKKIDRNHKLGKL